MLKSDSPAILKPLIIDATFRLFWNAYASSNIATSIVTQNFLSNVQTYKMKKKINMECLAN